MDTSMQTKCTCGAKQKYTCKNCSRIKMVMLLRNGYNDLKIKGPNGQSYNPVWYSHFSKNRYTENSIILSLVQAFNKSIYKNATRILKFYDVRTGTEIRSITL